MAKRASVKVTESVREDEVDARTAYADSAYNEDQEQRSAPPDEAVPQAESLIDRRIIEGMLGDRQKLMRDMASRGINEDEVMRRAAELGISEALLRQVRGVEAELAGSDRAGSRNAPGRLAARTCLSCDRVFLSTGPANRLCMRCRGGDAGLAQF